MNIARGNPSKQKNNQPKSIAVEIGAPINDNQQGDWKPIVQGHLSYIEGVQTLPFSGFVSGTNAPITGFFTLPDGQTDFLKTKPVGRPGTAKERDIAVFLFYQFIKFSNPDWNEVELRQIVVRGWLGHLPDVGMPNKFRGITGNTHVKRSLKNAVNHAPELNTPLRTHENLPLIDINDPCSGAMLEIVRSGDQKIRVTFMPPRARQSSTSVFWHGQNCLQFDNVECWRWVMGDEHAHKVKLKVIRPDCLFIIRRSQLPTV